MNNQSELARIEDEAATWAVLLADDPNNMEQLQQFSAWLDESALHADTWERTRRAYDGLGSLSPATQALWPENDLVVGGQMEEDIALQHVPLTGVHAAKAAGDQRSSNQLVARALGWKHALSGMAVAACLILVLLPSITLQIAADYSTRTGEQQIHQLNDGSMLTLAPESAVDIDYSSGERRVRILKGAVFFDVQHNPGRPFIVQAGDTRTTVLGTAFSVEMADRGTVVSVANGLVQVDDHSTSPAVVERLAAGDRLAVTWGEGGRLTRHLPESVARWRKGELIARDLSINEVVDSFRRYYSGVIVVTEPFASQRVTGLYRLDDPVATLSDMARAHGATATQISPWLLILSK